MDLTEGLCVALYAYHEIVAFGDVVSVDSSKYCHGKQCGKERCVVIITKVLNADAKLKYSHADFESVGDFIGESDAMARRTLWDKDSIIPKKLLQNFEKGCVYVHHEKVQLLSWTGDEVACGEFSGYTECDICMVKITKLTAHGVIENSMLDGETRLEVHNTIRWGVAFLKKVVQKRVSFRDPTHTIFNESLTKSIENAMIGIDVLTGVEEASDMHVDALTGVEEISDMHVDVLTGVEEISDMHVDALTGVEEISDMHVDALTGVEEISDLHVDVLTGVEEMSGHELNVEQRSDMDRSTRIALILGQKRRNLPFPRYYQSHQNNANVDSTFEFSDVNEEAAIPTEQVVTNRKRKLYGEKRNYVSSRRRRIFARIAEPKKSLMLSQLDIEATIMKICCKKLCLRKVSIDECKALRMTIWSKKGGKRHNYILQQFSCFLQEASIEETFSKCKLCPTINGKAICNKGYQWLTGLSHGTYCTIVAEAKECFTYKIHGNEGTCKRRKRTTSATATLQHIIVEHSLPQPHLQQTMPDGSVESQQHLPIGLTKKVVFDMMTSTLQKRGELGISMQYMYKIWQGQFCNFKTTKRQKMSKCRTCDELKSAIEHCACEKQREIYRRKRSVHLSHVQHSRQMYATWREQAMRNEREFMCLTIDGMDQNTTELPRFRRTPPQLEGKRGLKTHLCGVLVHGFHIFCDVWIDSLHEHDSNQVVTSIMKAICKMKEARGYLPKNLRVQADNCWRENKNRYMFGLCSMLVALKVFEQVEMGFLLVGHTHEDIDQIFSVISRELKGKDVLTMSDMLQRIGKKIGGNRMEPTSVELLERMIDWKQFITPHLAQGDDAITGHTNPHYFRFLMHDEKPAMMWKYYSHDGDEMWSAPYYLLQNVPVISEEKLFYCKNRALDVEEMKGLQALVDYNIFMMKKHPEQAEKNTHIIKCTEDLVKDLKTQENLQSEEYKGPFWMIEEVQQTSSCVSRDTSLLHDDEADEELLPRKFCGRKGDKPLPEFTPMKEIGMGLFVAVQSSEDDGDSGGPIWVAKIMSINNGDTEIPPTFTALWYEPKPLKSMPKKFTLKQLYEGCLEKKREWIPNKDELTQVEVNNIIHCWKSRCRTLKKCHGYDVEKSIFIPDTSISHIKHHLRRVISEDGEIADAERSDSEA